MLVRNFRFSIVVGSHYVDVCTLCRRLYQCWYKCLPELPVSVMIQMLSSFVSLHTHTYTLTTDTYEKRRKRRAEVKKTGKRSLWNVSKRPTPYGKVTFITRLKFMTRGDSDSNQ